MGYQLGLDTGGTYTDAVIVDDDLNVIASAKSLTTHHDLILGLRGAVEAVLDESMMSSISLVSLSTTLATNALVEGRGRPVALVLAGFSPEQMQRAHLGEALGGDPHVFVRGGHNAGGKAVSELDLDACRAFVEQVDHRVDAYAVASVFSVRNPAHENELQALISAMTGKPVTCGHHLSSGLDAPRRALTALLNARLIPMIGALLGAARALLEEHSIRAPLMVVKGDGSLMSENVAVKYPVETILSGPAASVVGAQYLCKQPLLIVSDMGGTTTDVAVIRDSHPRLNPDGATVGGWRTMVQAVDIRTYGLGGDSGIRYERDKHEFAVGSQRMLPLSLLALQHPEILSALEQQMSLPFSTTHSAQFVMTHGAEPAGLSSQQQELYDRIRSKPIAVQTLFADQTLERALNRLEQRGVVLRSAFTPSDACHILGQQSDWEVEGARLGAKLLMRYSADNLGKAYDSEEDFAKTIVSLVAEKTAMVLLDAVAATGEPAAPLTESQKWLFQRTFAGSLNELLTVSARLHVPVVALGAPAKSYYAQAASLLGAELVLPAHAEVANALGAVVGSIRQEQTLTVVPAGGKRVTVLFPDGPQTYTDLEEGAEAAKQLCMELAERKAREAGAGNISITHDRHDTIVRDGDQSVFFESKITAKAVGRPSKAF